MIRVIVCATLQVFSEHSTQILPEHPEKYLLLLSGKYLATLHVWRPRWKKAPAVVLEAALLSTMWGTTVLVPLLLFSSPYLMGRAFRL